MDRAKQFPPTRLFACAATSLLVAVAATGCQVDIGGQTLPSPWFMTDDVQYFPAGPEFKLSREAAALKAARLRESRPPGMRGLIGPPAPAAVPPAVGVPAVPPGQGIPGPGNEVVGPGIEAPPGVARPTNPDLTVPPGEVPAPDAPMPPAEDNPFETP